MKDCIYCWTRYMEAVALSKQVGDPLRRKSLIRTAYFWLDRYFEAEDHAVARLDRVMTVRSKAR